MDSEFPFQFCVNFYENLHNLRPTDGELIRLLASLYSQMGDPESSAKMDKKQIRLNPSDPIPHYNLACNLSVMGKSKQALKELTKAFNLGYKDFQWMMDDTDLDAIRKDPQFTQLIAQKFPHQ